VARIEPALRGALGLVFLASGVLKIADPSAFAYSVARLQLLPRGALGAVAIVLPWIEAVSGAALRLILGLLAGLTIVLLAALARGTAGPCGCFGGDGGFLSRPWVGVGRNLLLLGMAFTSCRRRSEPASPA